MKLLQDHVTDHPASLAQDWRHRDRIQPARMHQLLPTCRLRFHVTGIRSKFSAVANCPQAELSSRVASRQRSRDFTRDTLTALCLERTMLGLQVTQRITREHLHRMIKPERQTDSSDAEMSGEHLGTLLRQVSKTSMGEIESLIVELKTLHKKLQTDGDRIQRDIAEHAELSQQVMQLTKIISDSVKKLPGRAA